MIKRSISYEELLSGAVSMNEIESLVETGTLDDKTCGRLAHLFRFYARVGNACPNPDLKVGDVCTENDLQRFWKETAEEGAELGQCPLIH